ncbi:DUF4857 domain-containing protein [Arcobacter sp. CECT 8983]|uniref:DUF4857 domain-containing protein n=1 Tax=Arcobacter sp. CECT 8983 TaxID=2044508 RepID=UPI00100A90BB|nr:DUF4857 domain-containing protein [Arcobacter sp. CECT 8983]RXJ88731.1 DUF4857 domain-containing protein [Arcobacter sp. CECT 8983]
MIYSIVKKEWLKIKYLVISLLFLSIFILGYFWFRLDFLFSTVEPESMMWYRFITLEQKPYQYFSYLFYITAFLISSFQFIPEKMGKKIKIMIHLPIDMYKSLSMHLAVGFFCLFIICIIFSISTYFILLNYYPYEMIFIALKDMFFYLLSATILYLGISSAIIERKPLFSVIKLLITLFITTNFHKSIYTSFDLFCLVLLATMFFITLDSFYSIKEQRLKSKLYKSLLLISIVIVSFFSYNTYKEKYKKSFNKYYIFYSPIKEEFIYQKNFGEHHFEYGIKGKETFDRKTYESYLPFVYWRNLDIQNKLPIKIGNESFNKKIIKESRLSFSYNPEDLKKQELDFFPFINPISNIGMIKFPEEFILFKNKEIKIYNFDEKLDNKLTNKVKKLVKKNNVTFPIKNIWGKATNLKPFDLGYFFLDAKDKLFKINRANNEIYLKEVTYPKNIEIKHIKIAENNQQKLAGFAISKNNKIYLIDYKDLQFRGLELDNFDYKTMRLQLISNPKYYLIRYTDEKSYHVAIFDKNFKKIDQEIFK